MQSIQIAKETKPHTHICKRCGERFTATCDHVIYHEVTIRGRLQFKTRPAELHEFPVESVCSKPQCAFWSF